MEIIALTAHSSGYRGCLIEDAQYVFFQYTRKGRYRRFKAYPRSDFEDHHHFSAMMMKYMRPSAFLRDPLPIDDMNLVELDRIQAAIQEKRRREIP